MIWSHEITSSEAKPGPLAQDFKPARLQHARWAHRLRADRRCNAPTIHLNAGGLTQKGVDGGRRPGRRRRRW